MINNNSDEMKKELEIEIESSQGGCGGCGSHDHSGGGCGTHSHGASGGCGCGSHGAQQPADAFKPVVEEKIKTVQEKKMYEYVCYCDKVSKSKIITAIMTGAKTLEAVKEATGAISNPNCGEKNPSKKSCKDDILELIKMYG